MHSLRNSLVDNHDSDQINLHTLMFLPPSKFCILIFKNKRDDLLLHISDNEPDIIMITEVLPKTQLGFISEAQLNILAWLYSVHKLPTEL